MYVQDAKLGIQSSLSRADLPPITWGSVAKGLVSECGPEALEAYIMKELEVQLREGGGSGLLSKKKDGIDEKLGKKEFVRDYHCVLDTVSGICES